MNSPKHLRNDVDSILAAMITVSPNLTMQITHNYTVVLYNNRPHMQLSLCSSGMLLTDSSVAFLFQPPRRQPDLNEGPVAFVMLPVVYAQP